MFIGPKPRRVALDKAATTPACSQADVDPRRLATAPDKQSDILLALAMLRAERELRGFLAQGGKLN